MSNRRVVVTGIGAVTPIGNDADSTWKNGLEGKSGVGPITQFDASGCSCQIAASVKDFDVTKEVGPFRPTKDREVTQAANIKEARKMSKFIHFSLAASLEAYEDSGLDPLRNEIDPTRIGTNIGVGMGGLNEIEQNTKVFLEKGIKRVSPFLIPQIIPNLASGNLSILLDFQGPNMCNVTACSSSAHAIGESMHMIQRGDADIMVAGGAESVITPIGIGGFASMRALSTRNDEPEKASRPWDKDRDGFVMGEGASTLILEEYEFAKKRGAKIYAELLGYGLSGDAYHMTLPAPESAGGYRAMKGALTQAKLNPEQIDYVNAHGTSTPAGDVEEARAIAKLFPNGKDHLHISSTKSMTGHLLGAAGAIEAFFCTKAIQEGVIPPTINCDNLDPGCVELGLDFTINGPAKKNVNYALSNSFGFGGTNACMILGKV